jgi:hypothetical protein
MKGTKGPRQCTFCELWYQASHPSHLTCFVSQLVKDYFDHPHLIQLAAQLEPFPLEVC